MSNTTLHNFAYDNLPKKWGDFYGHDEAVAKARRFLLDKPSQSLFICGESGVGKTAFVLLLIKSHRCLNRPKGEIDPCGQCPACLEHDIRLTDKSLSDVYWLQPGGTEENGLSREVTNALLAADKGHRHTGRGKEDLLWVVADEFQGFPSNLRQKMLLSAELRNDRTNVCYVFITMQKEVLSTTERIAFTRRSSYLDLQPFTDREIYAFLRQKFPDCPDATAAIIAKCSENSIGLSLSHYDHIYAVDPELDPDVAAMLLHLANNEQRLGIWQHLEIKGNINSLKRELETVSRYVAPRKLASQLIEDIMLSVDLQPGGGPTIDQLFAFRILNQFLSAYSSNSLINYLTELYGLDIVLKEAVLKPVDYSLNYSIQV